MPRLDLHVNMDPYSEMAEDPCQLCCHRCICCTFCCKYVHKSTRIKIVWGLLLLAATASSVILGCAVFRPDTPLAAPSDMRTVSNHINFLFCEEVGIESHGLNFDTYRVAGPLKIDEDRRNIEKFNTAMYVERNDYDYYSFYFLPQSNITLFQGTTQPVIFYVFQGADRFSAWKEDMDCEECYLYKQYLQESSDPSLKTEFNLDISTANMYFLVYQNQIGDGAWVDIKLNLDRSIYDLTDAISVCFDSTDCSVVLAEPRQTVVYQVASYADLYTHRHSEFKTKCVPRVWSYLLFHITFILVIGTTCSILIQKLCRNPDSERYLNINERTPLIYSNSSPPSYTAVISTPPKYDDAIRYSTPPTYSEVTSGRIGNVIESQRSPKHYEDTLLGQRAENTLPNQSAENTLSNERAENNLTNQSAENTLPNQRADSTAPDQRETNS